ncbi:PAS domain-containing sensor histidine kinase [Hymenobacter koreensis]|uniref:histidine kinase n=1 Tax=Hymenobacter koreensis TaxID=1084523 RepID=A0ABP8JDJ8_9BACT
MPTSLSAADLLSIFNTQPGATLLLSPEWVIVGASDDYLAATLTERAAIVGQHIFDAFPDNPETPEANAVANVRASLETVLATRQPHDMAPQHYDVPDRTRPGQFVERHWKPRHTPVLDAAGQVQFIIQSVQDITATRLAERQLRDSQAGEQLARADAETQRQRFYDVLMQLPAYIAVYHGPEHIYQFVNPPYQSLFPHRSFAGRPFREGIPEATALGVVALFDRVYQTGEPYYAREMEGWFDFRGTGEPEQVFLNLSLYPLRDAAGNVNGVLDFSYNVTEQVRARRQVEQLNQDLEARVQARTEEAFALQADLLAAEQHQAELKTRLYQVFEQTPASIALLRGPEHRFEYVNHAYQALFPGRALVGHPLAQALPDAVDQGFLALLDGVYRTGETFFGNELPLVIEQPDGRPPRQVYFTFTYQAYHEAGQTAGVTIFAFDVTEQVRARQQREAERQQLHALFMEAPAPIVILDGPELVFQLVNPAYQRVFPGRALLGKPVLDALPEIEGTPVAESLRAVYETGDSFVAQELPLQLARHDGAPLEELFFTFTYQARRNAQGDIDGVLVFAHEVTAQVQARRVVEARETSFRQLADHVPGTLWVTDAAGECTYLNARWYAITGQIPPEGLGLGWTHAVHPDDAAGAGAAFLAANARREPFSCLFRLRQRDGAYRWVIDQGLPRFSAACVYEGMVGTVVDVDEQKLAELAQQRLSAELGAINQQLSRTNVDLDNFIYTASHDLKAPISNIEGLLHTLQQELPASSQNAEVAYILDMMQDSVDRFTRTIDHLTDVSKLQKEHDQPRAAVALADVIEDVRLDLVPLLRQTGGSLSVDVRATPTVLFSEKNLRSVVYNLLSNALKYRHPDRVPDVRVRSRVEGDFVVLEVQDNGLGLDLTREHQLFTMFRRYHTHVEGSGIGLYMVKRMVENAGGRIGVESEVGQGATFTVYLPH